MSPGPALPPVKPSLPTSGVAWIRRLLPAVGFFSRGWGWGILGCGGAGRCAGCRRATREARLDQRLHRFNRAPIRAGRRMWPGESRRFSFSGMHLSGSAMVFPWMPLEEEVEEEEVEAETQRARRPKGPGMRPVPKPWHSVDHAPARVVRGGKRTTRVSRGGRVRFEPTPRRAARNVAQAGELVGSVESRGRAPVSTGEQRARDLVRDAGPSRTERRASVARRSQAVPVQFQAGFQTPASRLVERQARRRPMDRLGDRVAAVLGPVRAAAAASRRAAEPVVRSANVRRTAASSQARSTITRASGTQRSVGVRTQSPSGARRSTASRGTSAPAEPPAGESARPGSVDPTLADASAALIGREAVQGESVADRTVQRWSASESAPSRSARSRVARARAAVERAVLGPALARAAQSTLTRHLDDGDVRPLALAAGRATQSRERRRGLRPVFRHSPMMSVVEPVLAEVASFDDVESTPTRAPRERQGPRVVRGFGSTGDVQRSGVARTASAASTPATTVSGGVVNPARTSAGSARRVSGTRWLAERIRVGTATDGSFRPAVMTRPRIGRKTSVAAASSEASGLRRCRRNGQLLRDGLLPHAASVFQRMQTGHRARQHAPSSRPRRTRTGQGRALFVSVPEAVPRAPGSLVSTRDRVAYAESSTDGLASVFGLPTGFVKLQKRRKPPAAQHP